MANNIWRKQPYNRLSSTNLYNKKPGQNAENVADDFFEVSGDEPTYIGILRRWNGSSWVKAKLMRYTGSIWAASTLKLWNGTQWGLIDTIGV